MPLDYAGPGPDSSAPGEDSGLSPESEAAHATTSPVLRVALVDDHQVMRSGFKALLASQKGIDVEQYLSKTGSGETLIDVVRGPNRPPSKN